MKFSYFGKILSFFVGFWEILENLGRFGRAIAPLKSEPCMMRADCGGGHLNPPAKVQLNFQ
jgi:hypothetical protein